MGLFHSYNIAELNFHSIVPLDSGAIPLRNDFMRQPGDNTGLPNKQIFFTPK